MIENIRIALLSVVSNKLRTFLTVLGVLIGVTAVVALLGIGQGVREDIEQSIEGLGSNLVIVLPGKVERGQPVNPVATISSTLTEDDVEAVREVGLVRFVTPILIVSGGAAFDGRQEPAAINLGTNDSADDIFNLEVEEGRFLSEEDQENEAKVIVLGSIVKDTLFGDEDAVGKEVIVRGEEFEVVGVLKGAPTTTQFGGFNLDASNYIPSSTVDSLFEGTIILRIAAQVRSADDVDQAVEDIREAIAREHGTDEDFSVLTQEDLLGLAADILNIITAMIVGIAGISLLVGGIGIMNMMLVTVTERTREIGIRKALGATRAAILTQFLTEAIIISFIGAGLGLVLAVLAIYTIRAATTLNPILTTNSIILAFIMAFAVGIIFGVAPAIRAANKDPIDALRYE